MIIAVWGLGKQVKK